MAITQEFINPQSTSFNFDLEFGIGAQRSILNIIKRFKDGIDPMIEGPILLGDFEIVSRVLTGENFLKKNDSGRFLKELRDQWGYLAEELEPIESFDKFFVSWSHYLITGEHLANPEDLSKLQKDGKKYAQNTIKQLLKKEGILPSELRELSDASLFLSLSGIDGTIERKDLIELKNRLKNPLEKIDAPNIYKLEDQVDVLTALSNYVLAKATSISFAEDGKLVLTF